MTGSGALSGLRVVEWGSGRSAAYAGKLLRGFGAEVVLVESASRPRWAAFPVAPGAAAEREREARDRFLHGGKRSVELDAAGEAGRMRLGRLLESADILIVQQPLRTLEALGLSPEELRDAHPTLIVVAISLGGLTPSGRYLVHSDLVANAISGIAHGTPLVVPSITEYPPLKLGGYQADYTTGLAAATSALIGVQSRRRSGAGRLIDVSAQAVLGSYKRLDTAYRSYEAADPLNASGKDRQSATGRFSTLYGLVPCKDGWFAFQASEQYQWDGLMRMMGDPAWSKEARFGDAYSRVQNWQEFEGYLFAWASSHGKDEIFHLGQANRLPVFPCYSVAEQLADPQQAARGFYVELPAGEPDYLIRVPGALVHLEGTPWSPASVAPEPGADNEAIFSTLEGGRG